MHAIFSKFLMPFSPTTVAIASLVATLSIANPIARAEPAAATAPEIPLAKVDTFLCGAIDSPTSSDYTPTTIYIHDPVTHELVPRVALVNADQTVQGAVQEIVNSYEGQEIGIKSYEVKVDLKSNAAQINFDVDSPRGGRVFQSLSSTNQYSLFEAIRETLALPAYKVQEVIFSANGQPFDI